MWKIILILLVQITYAMPMVILQSNQEELKSLSEIIKSDLKVSKAYYHAGRLQLLLKSQKEWGMLQCRLRSSDNEILIERTFRFDKANSLWAAHGCSDVVLQGLTGKPSYFSGRIAWVRYQDNHYVVEQSDRQLGVPTTLFNSSAPIISLAWTPDAKSLYYIKHNQTNYEIKRFDRIAKTHHKVYQSSTPLNDLVWDASQSQLIFTKAVHGMQKLFTLDQGQPRQLTFGKSIDVSPTVSKGKIVFVSDQLKSPGLYRLHSGGNKEHLALEGDVMATPMMYHHQLYWYDIASSEIKVYDSIKKETDTFLQQANVKAISPTPFGLLVATESEILIVDFEGGINRRQSIKVNVLSTSWMDVV